RPQGEKVMVRGKLDFQLLYRREGGGLQAMGGSIPFEETVNVPGLTDRDSVNVSWELDDLKAGMINSRKINVKALLTLNVQVESLLEAEAAVDAAVSGDGEDIRALKEEMEAAQIAVHKKDTYRIQENRALSASTPDMQR